MKKIIMILCLSYANIVFAVDMITPIPNSISYDKEKAKLGKSLYMDKSLSKDGKVSCNTCHRLDQHGVDGLEFSIELIINSINPLTLLQPLILCLILCNFGMVELKI